MNSFNLTNLSTNIIKFKHVVLIAAALWHAYPCSSQNKISPESVRLKHHNDGLIVDLGVGLWANPIPVDWDRDGDTDLLVSTNDKPSNGLYYFENNGSNIFSPGERIAEGKKQVTVSWPGGKMVVCTPGNIYDDFREQLYNKPVNIGYKQKFHSGRANQWKYADYNGDGIFDLIIGVSDWREYGWDDAFNSEGIWTNGPLHGYVYWVKNNGTNKKPDYGKARKILADGEPLDVYGWPSPNLVDWDSDGDLDLICGEFLDRITFFENSGTRTEPVYKEGEYLKIDGKTLHLELEMPEVVVYDWDKDSDLDIIVGKEDGRVVFIENTGTDQQGLPRLSPPVYFKQRAEFVKCGALATPCSYDWDGDGDEDIVAGNTAGFIEWIENLDGQDPPKWSAPVRLETNGTPFRIMAGPNLSIQGPAEAKWGYTVPFVADWNMDGLPDIILNSIIGKIIWLENKGSLTQAQLTDPQAVKVDWKGPPPKPAWNWWDPEAGELVVQWRTRPLVLDLNDDGLNDLVAIDHEGYLSFFQRKKREDGLILMPGKRIFHDDKGKLLRLNPKKAGSSGRRKIDLVDWDQDGDLDLLINSINTTLYRNIGSEDEFIFQNAGELSSVILGGHSTSPTTVDWDKDGIRDLLIGAEDGFFYLLKNDKQKR
ncbi:MAG: VCBS repeat-containing protein [Bacteroidota bacterium]